jgi:hypothetical protein
LLDRLTARWRRVEALAIDLDHRFLDRLQSGGAGSRR